jgi:septum formation protein
MSHPKFVPLILGSSSRFRQQVLQDAQIPFSVRTADIDERTLGNRDGNASELVLQLARAKAMAIKHRGDLPIPCILATSDQVVTFEGVILEKPHDAEEARQRLRGYRGKRAATVTSLHLEHVGEGLVEEDVDVAQVEFGELPDAAIEAAIAQGNILHCAGSFDHDDPALKPYIHCVGDPTSVTGMPLPLFRKLIARLL